MPDVHRSAIISDEAELAPDVVIGPGCVLTGRVKLASGVRLLGNVHLNGPVEIGESTVLYPFSCVGFEPQHRSIAVGASGAGVRIGAHGILREHTTAHGSTNEHEPTRIGDDVYMMAGAHVGHDCVIGDRVTMVNNTLCAGHVIVGDDVNMGGGSMVHQFCRVGRLAMLRGGVPTTLDIPPFCIAQELSRIGGPNVIGMRRAGIPRDEITAFRRAYRMVLRQPMARQNAISLLRDMADGSEVILEVAEFLDSSKRGVAPGVTSSIRGIPQPKPDGEAVNTAM